MISDILSVAVGEIDTYLASEVYDDIYAGPMRARIEWLRNAMDDVRRELDSLSPTQHAL